MRPNKLVKAKINPNYQSLYEVLMRALDQASEGKGKERHAEDVPFEEQKILKNARKFGYKALLFQAVKKAEESVRIDKIYGKEAAQKELLGAINYLAAAVIRLGDECGGDAE